MSRFGRPSLALAILITILTGCATPIAITPVPGAAAEHDAFRAFDTNSDAEADFFFFTGDDGRVTRLGYKSADADTIDDFVDLTDRIGQRRHVVLILDGIGFDLARRHYEAGGLRLFYPPSRVVTPYPSMTDICLSQALLAHRPLGYEAKYFDHEANELVGGSDAYMNETNEPHMERIHYTASTLSRVLGFLYPSYIFGQELPAAKQAFDRTEGPEFIAYFGSTAGMGTRNGAEGHQIVVDRIESLIDTITWEQRGQVDFTLMSDHGHSYTEAEPFVVADHLEAKGWALTETLKGDRDAVQILFGLVTYASFAALDPASLAADLVDCPGADIISYTEGETVVVLDTAGGRAIIRQANGRFAYDATDGDPLRLLPILANLKADDDGFIDADYLFAATADRDYPDPLQRIWTGHITAVEHPADVIVSLKDDYYAGSAGFADTVSVLSTHGSLNRQNTVGFIMSTLAPLPDVMRSRDIPQNMTTLVEQPWPAGE